MKTPAELAAILRERLIHSRPHYDIKGQPLRTIVVTQEWLEDMADAANALDQPPAAYVTDDYGHEGVSHSISALLPVGTPLYTGPSLADLTARFGDAPEVSGRVISVNKF